MKRTLLIAALTLGACATPGPPRPDFEAPPPPREVVVEPSVIEIPVSVFFGPAIEKAEAAVPQVFESNGWETVGTSPVGDVGVNYRLWREPLRVYMKGNKVVASVRVYYWLLVAHRMKSGILSPGEQPWMQFGSCGAGGENPREIIFTLETVLKWSPDWKIVSATSALPNVYPSSCNITALNVNITPALDGAVRPKLDTVVKMIDERLAKQADFSQKAREVWEKLQTPIQVEEGVWLTPNMEGIDVTPITGEGAVAATSIEVHARPAVVTGAKPAVEKKPLPPLKETKRGEGAFRIALKAELGFDVAADRLYKRLSKEPLKMKESRLETLAVNIYPSGRLCVIHLKVKGDVTGDLYLAGEPVYEEEGGMLYFKDLNFTLETESLLHRAAERLMHDDMLKGIREQARFKLGAELEKAREGLEKALNVSLDEHTSLETSVKEVALKSLYMGRSAFHAVAAAGGSIKVNWK